MGGCGPSIYSTPQYKLCAAGGLMQRCECPGAKTPGKLCFECAIAHGNTKCACCDDEISDPESAETAMLCPGHCPPNIKANCKCMSCGMETDRNMCDNDTPPKLCQKC